MESIPGEIRIGDWLVRPQLNLIERRDEVRSIEPKVMDVLVCLAEYAGEVLPKERILQAVWPDTFVGDEVLTYSISELRKALGDDARNPEIIQTIPRRGYRLIAPVSLPEPETRYRMLEPIGQGAMGEVHLAEDTLLKRKVAFKFLPEEKEQDEAARKRLLREARAAAALDHPYICKIYDTGELEGRTFIAMEYVAGETLKARLARERLGLQETLRIVRETAEALEAAHQEGIVHRDVKPSNVMLAPEGHVKVMDFGIAKRLPPEEAKDQEWTGTLTEEVETLGTVPYMSPEQLKGEPVDTRSDIFSFGVVLYEMLAGVHPFRQDTPVDTARAILSDDPSPLTDYAADIPELLQHTIGKMLAKDRDHRYQSVHEVKTNLTSVRPIAPAPSQTAASLADLLVRVAGLAAVILLIVSGWWMLQEGEPTVGPGEITSIAVLPLRNLMGDSEQEYFVDGMHEALITELSQIRALMVIARTSVLRYRDSDTPVREIARDLNVEAVIEGSVLRAGDTVRITTQLIDSRTEGHLWAQSFDRELQDILVLQSEVAIAIAHEIRAVLTPEEERRLASTRTVDPQAYQLCLKGNFQLMQLSEDGSRKAIQHYQEAIKADPEYAPAHAGLALAYTALSWWHSSVAPKTVHLPAKESALKALELDPNLAEAHIALARIRQLFEWDWRGADSAFRRGIDLNPKSSIARKLYANYLTAMGRFEESIAIGRKTLEIDPLSPAAYNELGWALEFAGETDAAFEQYRQGLEIDPDFQLSHGLLAFYYLREGMPERALQHLRKAGDVPDGKLSAVMMGYRGHVYGAAGQRAEALAILDQLKERRSKAFVPGTALALVHLGLGEKEKALDWLEKAYQEKNVMLVWLKEFWFYDPLRSDPQFQDLLRRMNFPE